MSSPAPPNPSSTPSAEMERIEKIMTIELRKQQKISSELAATNSKLKKLEAVKMAYLKGLSLGTDANEKVSETIGRSVVKSMCWRLIAGS